MLNKYPVDNVGVPVGSSGTLLDTVLLPENQLGYASTSKTNVGEIKVISSSAGNISTESRVYPVLANTLTSINIPSNENQSFIEFANNTLNSSWSGGNFGTYSGPTAYGNGRYVTLSYNGYVSANSKDLKSWTMQKIDLQNTWTLEYGVPLSGPALFVATPGSFQNPQETYSNAAYSYNGIDWNIVNMPYKKAWASLAYGNGIFASIGANYSGDSTDFYMAISENGTTWKSIQKPAQGCRAISFANGLFITCSGEDIYTSTDAKTWTLVGNFNNSPSFPDPVTLFTYGNGGYVGVSQYARYFYTLAGSNLAFWSQSTNNPPVFIRCAASFGNGNFVVTGSNNNAAAYSTNGVTWTQTSTAGGSLYLNKFINGKHLATGPGGVNGSTNGVNWIIESDIPGGSYLGRPINFNGKVFYTMLSVVGSQSLTFIYSEDGAYWKPVDSVSVNAGDTAELKAFFNNKFVFTPTYTSDIVKMVSEDFSTWTTGTLPSGGAWSFIVANKKLYGISLGTNAAAESTDGITWVSRFSPTSTFINSIAYGNGTYVVSVNGSTATGYSSTDAINWTARTFPTAQNWTRIIYGNGTFVGLNSTSTTAKTAAMSSTNGITWTSRTLPALGNWSSGTWGNGNFYIKLDNGYNLPTASSSTDGITWTLRTMSANNGYIDVYGKGRFLARTGDYGAFVLSSPRISTTAPVSVTIYRGPQEVL